MTIISCCPVLEAEDGLSGWRYRIPPCTTIGPDARRAPAVANSGWCWQVTPRSMAAIHCRPIPASSSARMISLLPAPQALSPPNCCACNFAAARGIESRLLRPRRVDYDRPDWLTCPQTQFEVRFTPGLQSSPRLTVGVNPSRRPRFHDRDRGGRHRQFLRSGSGPSPARRPGKPEYRPDRVQ